LDGVKEPGATIPGKSVAVVAGAGRRAALVVGVLFFHRCDDLAVVVAVRA
jgi:hypothetical protein